MVRATEPDSKNVVPGDVTGLSGTKSAAPAQPKNMPEDLFVDLPLDSDMPGPLGAGIPSVPHDQAQDMNVDGQAMEEDQKEGIDVDMSMSFIGSLEPERDDFISELLLRQVGSSGRRYRREGRAAFAKIVSEIYSPPRVTDEIRRSRFKHVLPGFAFDLTVDDPFDGQPWDFSMAEKRERARRLLRQQKPYLLIGSPACKPLNECHCVDTEAMRRARIAGILHMNFVISLYHEQLEGGRYFLHEHPIGATSWALPDMEALMQVPGVQEVRGDLCQYGAEIRRGARRGDPVMKPSGFLTNSPEVAKAVSKRCEGQDGKCSREAGGIHRPCTGQHATNAAKYPRGLRRAILQGITKQLKEDELIKDGCFGVQVHDDELEIKKSIYGPEQGYSGRYRDDLTGQVLRDDLVREARAKELKYFHSKGVWTKVAKDVAKRTTGRPPISVRWVDVNKGDEMTPNYRSRLVARQMKVLDQSGATYFAPAPPLEALRTVLSMAMTKIGKHVPDWDPLSETRTQISFVDVSRAYFNAVISELDAPTFVDLPTEDPDSASMCARLLRHMYGTRMAADGWQEEYSTMLLRLGFRQGVSCPNVFYHDEKGIVTSVHGDDFTSSGPKPALDWLEKAIAQSYEITVGPRLGPADSDAKEGRALNRIIRWCKQSIEYEADPRQVERLIAECGLEGAKNVATPGVKASFAEIEAATAELPKPLHTAFRGAAARGNSLAADRLDVQFACKEVCRWMANPSLHAWRAMKRLCRYLNGVPRLVYTFEQQEASGIDVYTDTDWAGCPRTRKSTSGGAVMLGKHTVKHWSATQTSVALSSGEAEFAGVIRGAGQGLGYQALLRDIGVDAPLRVWTDSSAAIGICSRQGLGKLRHLDTHTLWIQQAVRSGRVDLRKILGEKNPADLLTKHSLSRDRLEKLVTLFGCRVLDGRPASAPLTRRGGSNKVSMAEAGKDLDAVNHCSVPASATDGCPAGAGVDAEACPIMPHLAFSEADLEVLYPKLIVPDCDGMQDLIDDTRDKLFQFGMRIGAKIQEAADVEGRVRHSKMPLSDSDDKSSNALTATSKRTSTISAISRRRSARISQPFAHKNSARVARFSTARRVSFDYGSSHSSAVSKRV